MEIEHLGARAAAAAGEDDQSPVEQVRLTVPTTDDPSLPVWTFRMWTIGLLSCAMLSYINQFFSYRSEPIVITQITVQVSLSMQNLRTKPRGVHGCNVVYIYVQWMDGWMQVAALPIGHFLARVLPKRKFTVFGRECSLNPGPFNVKEHVLISIFANAGAAFGNGGAYTIDIINIIKAFYHRSISFPTSLLLVITTQVTYYTHSCNDPFLRSCN